MAYNSYTLDPGGAYTFHDDAGGDPLTAYGAAAYQKARALDDQRLAAAAGTQAGIHESLFGDAGGAQPEAPRSVLDASGVGKRVLELPAVDMTPEVHARAPKLSEIAKWDMGKGAAAADAGPKSDQARIAAGLGFADTTTAQQMAAGGLKPVNIASKGGAAEGREARTNPATLVGAKDGGPAGDQLQTVTGGTPGGGGVIKGGWRDTQKSIQKGVIDPDTQRELGADNNAEASAINDLGMAHVAQNDAISKAKGEAVGFVNAHDAKIQAAEEERQKNLKSTMAQIQAKNAELDKLPIDSEKIWADKGSGAKFAAALAAGLGAMGSTIAGGPNHALAIINSAIDRNIDAQKANLQNKRQSLASQESLLGQYRGILGDERSAEAGARARLLERGAQQIDALTANTQDPIILANAAKAKADLYKDADRWTAEMTKGVATMHSMNVPDQRAGGSAGTFVHDDIKKDQIVRGPDNALYEFGEGATAQKASEQLAAINQNKQDVEAAQAIAGNPINMTDPSKRSELRSIMSRIKQRNSKAEGGGGGRLNEHTLKLMDDAMGGDQTALLNFGKSAGLAEYGIGLRQEAQGIINQHAISKAKPYRFVDPKTGAAELRFVRIGAGPGIAPDVGAPAGE